jgi:hypothetical protein
MTMLIVVDYLSLRLLWLSRLLRHWVFTSFGPVMAVELTLECELHLLGANGWASCCTRVLGLVASMISK